METPVEPQPTIELIVDQLNPPSPRHIRMMPLPASREAANALLAILHFFLRIEKIEEDDGEYLKILSLLDFSSGDTRARAIIDTYDEGWLLEHDGGAIYDLLSIDRSTFVYCYYQIITDEDGDKHYRYDKALTEDADDLDEQLWKEFIELRDTYLQAYFKEVDFENVFSTIRKLNIGGIDIPFGNDAIAISGFAEWTQLSVLDKQADNGHYDALYIPTEPTIESFSTFIATKGAAFWRVVSPEFSRAAGIWDFAFNREKVFEVNTGAILLDSRRLLQGEAADLHMGSLTLIVKTISHMAMLWDVARMIKIFQERGITLLAEAFKTLYEARVERLLSSISGTDLAGEIAKGTYADSGGESAMGEFAWIAGFEEEEAPELDPEARRLTSLLKIYDVAAVFKNAPVLAEIVNQQLSPKEGGSLFGVISLLSENGEELEFFTEEQLEAYVLEMAYYPLSLVNKD